MTPSATEDDKVTIGLERSPTIARLLTAHHGVLEPALATNFAGWSDEIANTLGAVVTDATSSGTVPRARGTCEDQVQRPRAAGG